MAEKKSCPMESSIWNRVDICPPPFAQCSYSGDKDKLSWELVQDVQCMLNEAQETLNSLICVNQRQLLSEYTLLQKLLYKTNNNLHMNKFMHQLKLASKTLKQFLKMKLVSDISGLNKCWHLKNTRENDVVHFVASRQVVEFILVRLMGSGQLLSQLLAYCTGAFVQCEMNLHRQLHVTNQIIFLGTVSRIWILSRTLRKGIIKWYNKLRPMQNIIKGTQVEWLPQNATLPEELGIWLGPEPFDHSQNELIDKILHIGSKAKDENDIFTATIQAAPETTQLEDLGLPIKREETPNTQKKEMQIFQTANTSDSTKDENDQAVEPEKKSDTHENVHDKDQWSSMLNSCQSFQEIRTFLKNFGDVVPCSDKWLKKRYASLKHMEEAYTRNAVKRMSKVILGKAEKVKCKSQNKGKIKDGKITVSKSKPLPYNIDANDIIRPKKRQRKKSVHVEVKSKTLKKSSKKQKNQLKTKREKKKRKKKIN